MSMLRLRLRKMQKVSNIFEFMRFLSTRHFLDVGSNYSLHAAEGQLFFDTFVSIIFKGNQLTYLLTYLSETNGM